jgi:hypothetical protein
LLLGAKCCEWRSEPYLFRRSEAKTFTSVCRAKTNGLFGPQSYSTVFEQDFMSKPDFHFVGNPPACPTINKRKV